jgi:VWFA-related protein
MSALAAAEKIVREYHSPLRPLSLHFTSQSEAAIQPSENVEHMIRRLKQNGSKADRELTNNDGLISVYEAYLIERGDIQARQLAELRYAASLMLQYRNDLGEVDGHNPAQTEMIQAGVQNISRSLLASNFAQVSRTVDGLKAVVNAAAADPGNYPKSILLLSSGFSLGRTSMRSDLSSLFATAIQTARRKGIKVFTVNSAGLEVQQSLGIGASGAFLVRNPHLQSILETHAHSWRMDREEPLAQIATETGGRFLHSTNDLFGASADALRTAGDLYYLGFLSKQPVDGRFHKIRVVASAAVKVHARKGFYAGHGTGSNMAALDGEDWETVFNSAEQARKSGDLKEYASGLEKLVRMFPNQANFWYNLGSVKMALNEPQDAVDALQKCFALMPEDKAVGAALSRALVAAGFRSAAVETLQMVTEKHPKDLDLLIQLGRIYEADSRTQDAYRAYRRVLDITLAPPLDVYVLLTRTSVRLGRGTEAGLFISDYLARGGQESSIDQWRNALTTRR